jgi:hypothetical protein
MRERKSSANILRRAVTDPKYVGEIDLANGESEVVETAEHALVNKTARIVEKVSLRKIGTDHAEMVRDNPPAGGDRASWSRRKAASLEDRL